MSTYNIHKFEEVVGHIVSECGYAITTQYRAKEISFDLLAEKDGQQYCIEIKFSKITPSMITQICDLAKESNLLPILVSAFCIEPDKRISVQENYPELVLVDIANLLYATQYTPELRNDLIASLSYSIDGIAPQEGFFRIESLRHDDYTASLIAEMNACQSGHPSFRTYEILCRKLLENIFAEDLALWKEQKQSNNDLYRFDLLCRIKDDNQKTFWSILERYFRSKYVIFEFKNHANPISQNEIYTTEKYLYAKALRAVGIMIAANGYSENARWAAKGCLRENGKLILLLDTQDLIEMNKLRAQHEDPSNYLLDKLDNLLLELEK